MYLKSMTLKGFKSFASATTLRLEPGITCVVGPNGSGKSIVVDALTWVMGEQGAKSLRGGKMEDVIFAGTSGRAPLGRAEVSLTIDNSDGALPIDYTEVTISRILFRNGQSEYQINGEASRSVVDATGKQEFMLATCKRLGLSPSEVAAVGDGANDLPMLSSVGTAVGHQPKGILWPLLHAANWSGDHRFLVPLLLG